MSQGVCMKQLSWVVFSCPFISTRLPLECRVLGPGNKRTRSPRPKIRDLLCRSIIGAPACRLTLAVGKRFVGRNSLHTGRRTSHGSPYMTRLYPSKGYPLLTSRRIFSPVRRFVSVLERESRLATSGRGKEFIGRRIQKGFSRTQLEYLGSTPCS